MKGYVNSIQSLGTLDGPGVRFVIFMQGCNLRCACCHNPDTWEIGQGSQYDAKELADKAQRYREYFKDNGGVTLSGGEPLLQAEFATEIFSECKKRGINTALDTSGSILNEQVEKLLSYTDIVLLDIKYTSEEQYQKYVGCTLEKPITFLEYLDKRKIPTILRQVIIPSINDNEENIEELSKIIKRYKCVRDIELLPFKKMCQAKYDNLGIEFKLKEIPEPKKEDIKKLQNILKEKI